MDASELKSWHPCGRIGSVRAANRSGGWMDPTVSEWVNLIFRWIHVLAGVMWIGHLWFFNFVNAQEMADPRSEEHTSELQSRRDLVCRLLLEKKKLAEAGAHG